MRRKGITKVLITTIVSIFLTIHTIGKNSHNATDAASTSSPTGRFLRSENRQLSSAIHQMQQVARLATGISVQVGLMDRQKAPDDVFSELLNLGNVSISQLVSLNASQLETTFESLKQLPDKLKLSDSNQRAEKKLKTMDEMRVMVEGIDVTKWEGRKGFEEEMEKLKNDGVDLEAVLTLHGTVDDWNSRMKSIRKLKLDPKNKNNVDEGKLYIRKLNDFSGELVARIDNFVANKNNTWTYPKITSAIDALSSVTKLVKALEEAVKEYDTLKWGRNDKDDSAAYTAQLRYLADSSKAVNEVLESLQLVRTIVFLKPTRRSLKYSGFSNGYKDIDKIFIDLTDDFMRKMVDLDTITASLKPLKALVPSFEKVSRELQFGDEEKSKARKFFELVDGLTRGSSELQTITNVTQIYLECSRSFQPNAPNLNSISNFLQLAADLDSKVDGVDKSVDTFIGLLDKDNVREWLKKTQELAVLPNDDSQLGATLNALKNSKEVQDLNKVLVAAEDVKFNDALKQIKQTAEALINGTNSVDTFQKSLVGYPKLFHCLQSIDKRKAQVTASASDMIQKFRSVGTVLTDGEAVVQKVMEIEDDLSDLSRAHRNMSNGPTYADVFSRLQDPEKHSETLGSATQGILTMKNVFDAKNQVDVIIGNAAVVAAHLNNTALDPVEKVNLKAIVGLKTSLEAMNEKLDEWQSKFRHTSFPDLPSHSQMFTAAKSVPGVVGNFGELGKSVEKLASLVPDRTSKQQLLAIKASLDTLASFQLDFSSFAASFNASGDSLNALELFFASTRPTLPPPTPAPSLPVSPVAPQQLPSVPVLVSQSSPKINSTSDTSLWETILYYSIGSTVFFGIITSLIGICVVEFRDEKKKEEEGQSLIISGEVEYLPLDNTQCEFDIVVCTWDMYNTFMMELASWVTATKCDEKLNNDRDAFASFCGNLSEQVSPNNAEVTPIVGKNFSLESRGANGITTSTCFKLEKYESTVIKDDFINANTVVFRNGLTFILTQAPVRKVMADGVVKVPGTGEKFFWMVRQAGAKRIVNLCCVKEGDFCWYIPKEKDDIVNLAGLEIKCLSVTREFKNHSSFILRELAFKFEGYAEIKVEHYQSYEIGWRHDYPSRYTWRLRSLMNIINKSADPVVVHCSDGTERATAFAFIEMCRQEVFYSNGHLNVRATLQAVHDKRYNALKLRQSIAFCLLVLARILEKEANAVRTKQQTDCLVQWDLGYGKTLKETGDRYADMWKAENKAREERSDKIVKLKSAVAEE